MKKIGQSSRRGFIGGAIAAPAAIAATSLLPAAARPVAAAASSPSGYRLTEHVRRYYETLKR